MFEKERSDLAAYLNDYTEKEKKRIENDIAFHINSSCRRKVDRRRQVQRGLCSINRSN